MVYTTKEDVSCTATPNKNRMPVSVFFLRTLVLECLNEQRPRLIQVGIAKAIVFLCSRTLCTWTSFWFESVNGPY